MNMKSKEITEADLRHPMYRQVGSLDELERDDFGAIVRKDRYKKALRTLGYTLYDVRQVVWFVETLEEDLNSLIHHTLKFEWSHDELKSAITDPKVAMSHFDHLGEGDHNVTLLLTDGSLLRGAKVRIEKDKQGYHLLFSWRGQILNDDVQAMRMDESGLPLLALMEDRSSFMPSRTMSEQDYRQKLEALRSATPRIEPLGGAAAFRKKEPDLPA
jgi:hypothetical protein